MIKHLVKTAVLGVLITSCGSANKRAAVQVEKYEPTWESLAQYKQAPDWFRDAKFGIWAHWGPQCEPGQGDWYARGMYEEGSGQYNWHVKNYGHPSQFGFKDVINKWKADQWQPEKLMALYKRAGAKYFFALGNHHDNLDLWDSKHHNWNSVNMGPKKDILAGWEKAARNNGLYFGVSIHSAHAWTWYETAQRSDKNGPLAGVPYDGKLTKEDGKGKWWEGYDPQELYAQNHALSAVSSDNGKIHSQWNWGNGASVPTEAYFQDFLDRNIDMMDKYNPDLVYYDDTALPLWPVSDVGLKAVAYYYNKSVENHNGKNEAVVFGKILNSQQKDCIVWDVEKGAPDNIQDKPWQTCTCIGNWHYDINVYNRDGYKSAQKVLFMLIDIVSKNGNLLLSVPVRGNGTIDEKEEKILNDIAAWMDVNSEGVFGTRPWTIYGEGPSTEVVNPMKAQGFNEDKVGKMGEGDFRFVAKGNNLYVHVFKIPENGVVKIKALGNNSGSLMGNIAGVSLLGTANEVNYKQEDDALVVEMPKGVKNAISYVLKVTIK
jgi:alpha-L-fucosidase